MAAQSKFYNTGGGELFFTPMVDGVLGTEVDFGQTENITFTSENETLEHDNTESCVVYEDISILKKVTGTLAIDTIEISPDMLTKAFLGTDYTVLMPPAAGTARTDVTVASFGDAYEISGFYLENIVVKDDTDTDTYVLNTDYTLSYNDKTGVSSITFIDGGSGGITVSDIIHIVADNLEYSSIRIEAFTQASIFGKLRFVSCAANGISYEYTFHKVSLLSSGDYALKSAEDFITLSFEGKMLASELITDPNLSKLFVINAVSKV